MYRFEGDAWFNNANQPPLLAKQFVKSHVFCYICWHAHCDISPKKPQFGTGASNSNCSEGQIKTYKVTRGPRYAADVTMAVPEPY